MTFIRGLLNGLIFRQPEQGSPDAGEIVFIYGHQCGIVIFLLLFMLLLGGYTMTW